MHPWLIGAAIAIAFCLGTPAAALTIAEHVGANDPTGEDWNQVLGGAGPVVTGPIDDGGTAAWSVDDQGNAQGTTLLYTHAVSDAEITLGAATGWTLRVVLRVPTSDVTDDGSAFAAYRDGTKSWQMNWGHTSSGDTIVKLFTDTSSALVGPTAVLPGTAVYRSFELVYDPASGTADLFVDGGETISDYAGLSGDPVANQKLAAFGAGRSTIAAEGRYAEVSLLLSAPEPAGLLAISLLGAAIARRVRQR